MNNCIDLILGKAFCIFIFFHFRDSRLSVLKGFHFYFCFLTWVKTENCFLILGDKFLFLNHFFIFLFLLLLFYVILLLLIFTKTMLLLSFYLINFFFMKITFIFSCSGMFRHAPGFIDAPVYVPSSLFEPPPQNSARMTCQTVKKHVISWEAVMHIARVCERLPRLQI